VRALHKPGKRRHGDRPPPAGDAPFPAARKSDGRRHDVIPGRQMGPVTEMRSAAPRRAHDEPSQMPRRAGEGLRAVLLRRAVGDIGGRSYVPPDNVDDPSAKSIERLVASASITN